MRQSVQSKRSENVWRFSIVNTFLESIFMYNITILYKILQTNKNLPIVYVGVKFNFQIVFKS